MRSGVAAPRSATLLGWAEGSKHQAGCVAPTLVGQASSRKSLPERSEGAAVRDPFRNVCGWLLIRKHYGMGPGSRSLHSLGQDDDWESCAGAQSHKEFLLVLISQPVQLALR